MTPDPIGLWGGINLYTYAVNNPINKIDPLGLLYATPGAGSFHNKIEVYVQTRNVQGLKDIIALGGPLAAKAAADALNKLNENTEDEECEEDNADPLDDYPADPDEWSSPEGWEETPAGEKTGGRHRQWRGPNDELRRWDKEGRHGGQERGPHWHDPRYPGRHIDPNR